MTTSTQPIPWQGIDHPALATHDLDETIHFYRDVLGMQAGEIYEARGGKTRHCFIKPGATPAQGLHFWEMPGAQLPPLPESLEWQRPATIMAGTVFHIAFSLPNEMAAQALRERLRQHDARMSEISDLGHLRSMVFFDNNHLMLEAIWSMDGEL
ncbi:hypothetical protein KDH_73060 [Dictyobacter sp. S3.2.2.5]|uniref:VOC domain-containing protein n=1 Tax=Dictyobacter halimunensis TaxID=3026934 RepID=A0ABQ6G2Z7_9CHLR|nr:hypothetical protein KDH_73060 [Dictyobacter sp. S3.2.2.5]